MLPGRRRAAVHEAPTSVTVATSGGAAMAGSTAVVAVPARRPHRARRRFGAACGLVTALGLAACSSGGGSSTPAGVAASPPPVAHVTVTPGDGASGIAVADHVVVRANAPLAQVSVNRQASATEKTDAGAVLGEFSADRRTWTSNQGLFAASRYDIAASTSAAIGITGTTSVHSSFETGTPERAMRVSWEPVAGQTVGVGAPISLTFNAPVTDRAAVQSRLAVRANPPTLGAWHWVTNRLVVWRPQQYWTPGTQVHVEANLAGMDVGGDRFGVKDRAMDFVIGSALISKVDAATHIMKVFRNGALLRTMPVSLGKPSTPSMDGPHNVLGKSPEVIMDSATVGVPKGNPDYYYEKVQWAVNYTSGGQYVHSAPWSVPSQGRDNVSHGCINASPADAEWFYNLSHLGDIVDISNTGRPADTSQLGNYWSVSWNAWKAASALPVSDQPETTASPSVPATAPAPAGGGLAPATTPSPAALAAGGA
ncbi:Ig-like domain-containing protein [Frankia sp. R82]|uniref:L,D-transpeptidase n=1 Tax=Frankia sp. R82 TaxID=2950553 RepID=UPI0020435978|nr:Ig-like domain-containing protein [Frankia sp. R82]MCM3884497.1 Ig-like domain-containing protein [Frankia sp. R82]